MSPVWRTRDATRGADGLRAELEVRLRQQAAVAAAGQLALSGATFDELLAEIVESVRTCLSVDIVGYIHCIDGGRQVRAMAGVGWPPGYEHDGRAYPLVPGGLTELSLQGREPVIIDDVRSDVTTAPVLVDAGIRSSLLVPIHGDHPLGMIGAHSCTPRSFTEHDAAFLAAAANVVVVAHGRLDAEARTRHRATHDALTELPNRELLREHLELALDRGRPGAVALLLMDLDGFKEVNDTLGHAVGDSLLQAVAQRQLAVVPAGALVARLGGDEFAILLDEGCGADRAADVGRLALAALDHPFPVDGLPISVDASIGLARSAVGTDATGLLRQADLAMYRAKRIGSGIELADATDDGHERGRLALAGEVRAALDAGDLHLLFQPEVSIADGRIVAAEALLRWNHPERGLLLPEAFLVPLEATTTILAVSRWVLDTAVAQAARWRAHGLDLSIAVNCSTRYLQHPTMVDDVVAALVDHDFPAERLIIEITESAMITNPTLAAASVNQLAGLGVRVSIDDFGTGYASLALLERLPVSQLKIDRRFVAGLDELDLADPAQTRRRQAIVQLVVDLGRNLGLEVVAEGVETEVALGRLRDLGCELAQGFLLAHPLTAAELADRASAPAPA